MWTEDLANTYRRLQTTHLLLLAARNQRDRFGFHAEVSKSQGLLSLNPAFAAIQPPSVVTSGRSRKEAIASPIVTSGSGPRLQAIMLMLTAFIRLQTMTTMMIARLNCSLQCSCTRRLKQY